MLKPWNERGARRYGGNLREVRGSIVFDEGQKEVC